MEEREIKSGGIWKKRKEALKMKVKRCEEHCRVFFGILVADSFKEQLVVVVSLQCKQTLFLKYYLKQLRKLN